MTIMQEIEALVTSPDYSHIKTYPEYGYTAIYHVNRNATGDWNRHVYMGRQYIGCFEGMLARLGRV